VGGGRNAAFINLEPESARLTNFGRTRNSPLQQALRQDKESAFGLFQQELERDEQLKEQERAQKKALRKSLIGAAIGLIAKPILGALSGGFSKGLSGALEAGGGFFSQLGGGLKGIGQGFGSLFGGGDDISSLISSLGGSINSGLNSPISSISDSGINPNAIRGTFRDLELPNGNFNPRSLEFDPSRLDRNGLPIGGGNVSGFDNPLLRASGGSLPDSLGVDTIPAMLSGGEFVLNNAAAGNIGAGNLQALNAGSSNILTEEKSEDLNQKVLNKLDELITAAEGGGGVGDINITVNSDGSSQSEGGGQSNQNLGQRIRDAVIRVIEEEKRLGGTLRRGLA
jgi:hypothetical protein